MYKSRIKTLYYFIKPVRVIKEPHGPLTCHGDSNPTSMDLTQPSQDPDSREGKVIPCLGPSGYLILPRQFLMSAIPAKSPNQVFSTFCDGTLTTSSPEKSPETQYSIPAEMEILENDPQRPQTGTLVNRHALPHW